MPKITPVAWRYRVRTDCIWQYNSGPTPLERIQAVDVEPLYAAAALQSQADMMAAAMANMERFRDAGIAAEARVAELERIVGKLETLGRGWKDRAETAEAELRAREIKRPRGRE